MEAEKDQKFKIILRYIATLRLAWTTLDRRRVI